MRRDDFLRTETEFFQEVARRCQVGYLALVTADGHARSVALNFAAAGETIYFHGALAGEKFDIISTDHPVGFTMAWELSYIPSNWTGPEYACPATQLFKSVEIKGRCLVVQDPGEKAHGLQALMQKHQPEGKFRPITADDPIYRKALRETGVFKIKVESWTGKVRLFQEKPLDFQRKIIGKLRERGLLLDGQTITEMQKMVGG